MFDDDRSRDLQTNVYVLTVDVAGPDGTITELYEEERGRREDGENRAGVTYLLRFNAVR
jgi:hypothetical protein